MTSELADGPLALLTTPSKDTGKVKNRHHRHVCASTKYEQDDAFSMDASHMAVVHNVILRGYNSIHKRARSIRPHDVRDFLGYCRAWVDMVVSHHHSEEAVLFPMLTDAAGVPGLMDTDKDEHGIGPVYTETSAYSDIESRSLLRRSRQVQEILGRTCSGR